MKNLVRIIIAIFIVFISFSSAWAEGYNMLVIPDTCISQAKKNTIGDIDIEELLARKFIDKLEGTGRAYAPTLRVLKISIKNNPYVKPDSLEVIENAKILSKSYGVPNVLVISSKIESKTGTKTSWNRPDMPILTPQACNTRIVTKITMYNSKNNEVIWTDTYYKNIDQTRGANIEAVNNYYDGLISRAIDNMRETKETHAIMLSSVPNPVKRVNEPDKQSGNNTGMKNLAQKIQKQEQSDKTNITKQDKTILAKNISTPDLRMKEEVETKKVHTKKEHNTFNKLKDDIKAKYENIIKEREIAQVKRTEEEKIKKAEQLEKEKQEQELKQIKLAEKQEKAQEQQKLKQEQLALKLQKEKEQQEAKKIQLAEKLKKEKQEQELKQIKLAEKQEKAQEQQKLKQEQLALKLQKEKEQQELKKIQLAEQLEKQKQEQELKQIKLAEKQEKAKEQQKLKQEQLAEKKIKEQKQANNKIKAGNKSLGEWFKEKKEHLAKIMPHKQTKTVNNTKNTDKEKLSDKIKSKYEKLKVQRNTNQEKKIKPVKQQSNYTDVILQEDENTSAANRYIRTRPRYNSMNYTPQFDNSVNDI